MEFQTQQNLNITHYSITIREMQIKTANEILPHISHNTYHQKIYKQCWRGCRENRTLLHCWWECKLI